MQHMSPWFGVLLMMNNYFHDVATALLAATGIALGVIVTRYEGASDAASAGFLQRIHGGMSALARFTLYWILLGGIPRTLYFRSFEWKNAMEHNQIPALMVKHTLAFVFVAAGAWLWKKYSARARELFGGVQDSTRGQG